MRFAELIQDGWGRPAAALAASSVHEIRFRFPVDVGGTACVDGVVLLRWACLSCKMDVLAT